MKCLCTTGKADAKTPRRKVSFPEQHNYIETTHACRINVAASDSDVDPEDWDRFYQILSRVRLCNSSLYIQVIIQVDQELTWQSSRTVMSRIERRKPITPSQLHNPNEAHAIQL